MQCWTLPTCVAETFCETDIKERAKPEYLDENLLEFVTSKSKEAAGLTWLNHSDPYFVNRDVVSELQLQFDCRVWMSDVLEVVHGTSAEDYLIYPIHKLHALPTTLGWPNAFGLTLKVGPAFWQRFDDYLAEQASAKSVHAVYVKRIERLEEKLGDVRKQLRAFTKKGSK